MVVQLAAPVYHVGFLPEVLKVLHCVCFHCAKFRCRSAESKEALLMERSGKRRLAQASLLCKAITVCDAADGGCNFVQVQSHAHAP